MELVSQTPEQLVASLESPDLLLVDVRPSGQFCSGHVRTAENLNFSNILLRRLLKGVVKMEAMLTSPELVEKVCRRRRTNTLVLCDSSSSSTSCRRPELVKHAQVFANTLRERDALEHDSYTVYYIDGGYSAFSQQFPHLCEQSSPNPSSHVQVSVSASLPVSLPSGPQLRKLQSAPVDDSDRYGPPVDLLPHLVLGCAKDSSNLLSLRELGVTAVLNVSHNCPSLFPTELEYLEIRVPDTYQADLLSRLQEAFQFIDDVKERGGRVLVHCHAGVSRSATVCMAYIMKTLCYDLRSAYDFVKRRRSCVSPNLHFMGQLLEFEKRLGACESARMEGEGFSCGLSAVQEEERERPCSLLSSWTSKDKRRAVSTPASLELSPYTIPSRKPTLSPCRATPTNSLSLPATPLPSHIPLTPPPPHHSPLLLLHQSPLHSAHIAHSCSLQSLVGCPITTAAAQNSPRTVTESL